MIFNLRTICALSMSLVTGQLMAQQEKPVYSWNNLPTVEKPVFKKDTFNIVSFGAKMDGGHLNTDAINKAIDVCSYRGGGVVLIPQGLWLTGPIELKNNVNLHISRSAVLQFTADKSQYKLTEGFFEGRRAIRNQSPIFGSNLVNIAITGSGVVDANGSTWRAMGKDRVTENEWKTLVASGGTISDDGKTWYPSQGYKKAAQNKETGAMASGKGLENYVEVKDYFRPNLLVLNNCKKVLLSDVTFENSPGWCLHTLLCENLTFSGVRVRNEPNAQNGDGMDIESCSYVLVENCTLDCGDDGICIKSGKDEEGRKLGKPTAYVVVRNNIVYKAHGGFVIGSEMSGGAHDIFVSDCSFIGTDNGLRFKTVRGRGGIVENIFIRGISMHNIEHTAILFDMYYFTKALTLAQAHGKIPIPAVNDGTPVFRNFQISNLNCDSAKKAMLIRGLPEMGIKGMVFKNININSFSGADIIEANNITFDGVKLICKETKPVINIENSNTITIRNISTVAKPVAFFAVSGDRINNIDIKNAYPKIAPKDITVSYGAERKAISVSN